MGLLGFDANKTSAKQTYTAATDSAKVASGKGAVITEQGGLNLSGKGAKYIAPGSVEVGGKLVTGVDLAGASAKGDLKVVGGPDFAGNTGTVTITNTAEGANEIASTFAQTVKDLSTAQQTALQNLLTQQAEDNTTPITATGTQTPETASADTEAAPDNQAAWIAGLSIAAALLGIWYFFFRK
jgi:ABC-type Na+ efflux pump permease subunit